jgi:poly(hydroxyalkanoate) depolymerase family esterase
MTDEFLSGVFKTDAGERRYKLFRPGARPPAGQRTLVIVLHGCTQDADDIARGTHFNGLASDAGFEVLYPEQPQSANALKCWNWYLPEQITRGIGEVVIIAELTKKTIADEAIDPKRVYIAGISAGGAMAANLAVDYPELYAAIAVHSGLPALAAKSQPEALAAMAKGANDASALGAAAFVAMGANARVVPAILFHGAADPLVSLLNLRASARQWVVTNALAAKSQPPEAIDLRTTDDRLTGQRWALADGTTLAEAWRIEGVGHAWSGGTAGATYVDPKGPDVTVMMLDFFARHRAK